MARLGRLAAREVGPAARHLPARAEGRSEGGEGRRRLFADDLRGLQCIGANSKKKTLIAAEQDRPDVAQRRGQWQDGQGEIDPDKLVFLDETWAKTNMTRTYGRSPSGTRLIEKTPSGRWQTTTF